MLIYTLIARFEAGPVGSRRIAFAAILISRWQQNWSPVHISASSEQSCGLCQTANYIAYQFQPLLGCIENKAVCFLPLWKARKAIDSLTVLP